MGLLWAMLKHPDEVYPLIKLKMEARKVMRKQIPPQPHWGFCFTILPKVETIDDFDEYCHYAAGLVGIGLSRLFHTAWKEDLTSDSLSNSMGLFLQMMSMGTLAMCYNNIQVFRGVVQIRPGLTAKIIDRAKTMEDVYNVFYDFSCMIRSKVNINDPNASKTLERLEIIMKTCRESGALNNRLLAFYFYSTLHFILT
nr:squalene synthase [Ipomoea batatas]